VPRPDRSRVALIESAATLFRRQGYAATGINQILAAADVKAGSLYHHFPDGKAELAAAVVGGFATVNTMIMSVAERTREIGIKKAVGASDGQLIREFLLESALIGLLGGAIGVAIGKVATIFINEFTKANVAGLSIFDLTPRLALLALAFATVIGGVAGLIPAVTAARMNVVNALRTE